jgi:hypothetical protein
MKRKVFIIISSSMVLAVILVWGGLALADYPPANTIKWLQQPDPNGFNVKSSNLFDDFLCNQTGTITDVHIWGSYKNDAGPDPNIYFQLSLWSNNPGPPYSHPEGKLAGWYWFFPGQYTVQYWEQYPNEQFFDPAYPNPPYDADTKVYLYNFQLPSAFAQQQGNIYWLGVHAVTSDPAYTFGWKSALPPSQIDDAVWYDLSGVGAWIPLTYPGTTNSMDLAFIITGPPAPIPAGVILFGTGLLGLLGFEVRRRR